MLKITAQEEFWNWFIRHEEGLFTFDSNNETEREKLFDRLAIELQKVHPNLTFEFGPNEPVREFVISAGGIRRVFPAIASLVDAAPRLDRWQVIAFRPRRIPLNIVQFRGKRVDPKAVEFSLLDNGKTAGIYLFIPGFREDDAALKQIGYLLLQETLGEYDAEVRLGLIKMLPPDARTTGDRYPLVELPALFDQLVARLEGRSGKAS